MSTSPAARLRRLIAGEELIVAPGIYDGLTAALAERHGFPAAYVSGGAASCAVLGRPDLGLMTASEMIAHTSRLRSATSLPLVVDIDTGYGNELNVRHTIESYVRVGAAAVHLEDQVFPKRCGHLSGKAVIPTEDAVSKVRAAVAARADADLVVIARTDARAPLGLREAIDRANRFADAGADMIFLEAPESVAEMETIAERVEVPLVANVLANSRTPVLSTEELAQLGFRLALYPAITASAAVTAVDTALATLGERGRPPEQDAHGPAALFDIVGLDDWLEWSEHYTGTSAAKPHAPE
ncbi:isocitrate lyase/PEP mutase family protein [Streptomyces luomodiensis]|uniref:Isocitrate lyase/PEP mutase family protein n=1 Tax=Streptomyces luomodiensis TaxID=3026192 RepID=A0ABY9UUJ9_9ACTN|nr:isocitrate lyase/PEP mutase family protein [Streptomyces sp. SCA4-21]WNE95966.1 isocitrate lyase/PEP mutase family protein [Streptomyces sp. SCA4-21]